MARNKGKSSVVVGTTPKWKFSRRTVGLGVGLLLIIIGIVLIISMAENHNEQSDRQIDRIVTESAKLLKDGQNPGKIKTLVAELKKQPGSDKDADALYVITNYYLLTGDSTNAQQNYAKLDKAYDSQKGYRNSQLAGARKPVDMKASLEYLKNRDKLSGQGTLYGPTLDQVMGTN